MSSIPFVKMHGLANDFVVVDAAADIEDFSTFARTVCDRHCGVGADGLIAILPSAAADVRMRIFNSDGSEAGMCGNGIRCVGKFIGDRLQPHADTILVETMSGIKSLRLFRDGVGKVDSVEVDMCEPVLDSSRIPSFCTNPTMIEYPLSVCGNQFAVTGVSMGNPHGVVFVDNVDAFSLATIGPELENHTVWPEKANIEFVELSPDLSLRQRTWERGVGETRACGTGACAAAVAAVLTGRANFPVDVHLLGGILHIDRSDDGHILMTGPAVEVFTGSWQ